MSTPTFLKFPRCSCRNVILRYLPGFSLLLLLILAGPTAASGQSVRIVTTIAGLTHSSFGNGGPAVKANLYYPNDVTVDAAGNVYIADSLDLQVRKIDAATGNVSVIAGTGQNGYSGDGQLAINAQISDPEGIAVDSAGNVYIADTENSVIREVSASTGIISTIAGNGTAGNGSSSAFPVRRARSS